MNSSVLSVQFVTSSVGSSRLGGCGGVRCAGRRPRSEHGQQQPRTTCVASLISGISQPLTNSSSISACRTAASSAACRTRAEAPTR